MVDRRNIIRGALMVPVALVGGCEWLKGVLATEPSKVADDIHTISGAVKTVRNAVSALTIIPGEVRDKVVGWLDAGISAAKGALAAASDLASQPWVVKLGDSIKAALDYAKGLLPSSASGLLGDALDVLSVVKSAVGIVSTIALAPAPAQVDAARLRLKAAAARGTL